MKNLQFLGLALSLGLTVSALGVVNHDISTGNLMIMDDDEYVVTGSTTAYVITVNSGSPTITLDDVTINVEDTAFDVAGGSPSIVLSGSSSLTSAGGPGLRVAGSAAATFSGSGSLTVRSNSNGSAGLGGGNGETPGAITINGGAITAYGALYAAGIGGGAQGNAGNLTINGGSVTATAGTYGAAIGGGTGWNGHAGNIVINGGYVKAIASNSAGIGCGDEGGHNTYPAGTITITGGTVEASASEGAGIGAGKASGDSGRGPNIYISGGSIKATSTQGSPIGPGKGASECPTVLDRPSGSPVYCATVEGAVSDHSQNWNFTLKQGKTPYLYAYYGPGHTGTSDLFFYLPNGKYSVSGAGKNFSGTIADGPASFTQYVPGTVTFSVAYGDITISSDTATGYDEEGNDASGLYGEYVLTGSSTQYAVTLTSGTKAIVLSNLTVNVEGTAFDVQGGNANITLKGDNALTSAGGPGLHVANGSTATFGGSGSLTARSNSNGSAGLGGGNGETPGAITINSGAITAYGATYAAGIGGGAQGNTGNLTINGGFVTATAGAFGSGIGGGTGWNGHAGNIVINGGYVRATASNASAIGCGDEGGHNTYPAGNITITAGTVEASATQGAGIGAGNASGDSGRGPNIYISGGSVLATSVEGAPIGQGQGTSPCPTPKTGNGGEVIYCATLPDATAAPVALAAAAPAADFNFTTTRGGEAYSFTYTGQGHNGNNNLYFYLPDGNYVVTGNNGKTFGGTIDDDNATFEAIPEPAFGLLALLALALLRRK